MIRWVARVGLLLGWVLLVYGVLYPFDLDRAAFEPGLLGWNWALDGFRQIKVNGFFALPVGFVAVFALGAVRQWLGFFLLLLATGLGLQLILTANPATLPSYVNIVANFAGAMLGVGLALPLVLIGKLVAWPGLRRWLPLSGVMAVALLVGIGLWVQYRSQQPVFRVGMARAAVLFDRAAPKLPMFEAGLAATARRLAGERAQPPPLDIPALLAKGFGAVGPGISSPRPASPPLLVASVAELLAAIRGAAPGDQILLLPGDYTLTGRNYVALNRPGRPDAPIRLGALALGDVRVAMRVNEGFLLSAPHWIIENLVIEGDCGGGCAHGLHIVGDARQAVIRNNVLHGFDTAIKVNAQAGIAPDQGLIERNLIFNDQPTRAGRSASAVHIEAAGWTLRSNVIADTAAAFKGEALVERNLILCEWRHHGGARLGISLRGGGVIRNNIIVDCPNEVGIDLDDAAAALVHNNILVNSRGIDMRGKSASARIVNNVLDGRILVKDGKAELAANRSPGWRALWLGTVTDRLYAAPRNGVFIATDPARLRGVAIADPGLDYCGRAHDPAHPYIGAFNHEATAPCPALLLH